MAAPQSPKFALPKGAEAKEMHSVGDFNKILDKSTSMFLIIDVHQGTNRTTRPAVTRKNGVDRPKLWARITTRYGSTWKKQTQES